MLYWACTALALGTHLSFDRVGCICVGLDEEAWIRDWALSKNGQSGASIVQKLKVKAICEKGPKKGLVGL